MAFQKRRRTGALPKRDPARTQSAEPNPPEFNGQTVGIYAFADL